MMIIDILDRMIVSDKPGEVWKQSRVFIEPIERLKKTVQRNNQTVFDHSMDVLNCLPIKNYITILAGLFHDSGKPDVMTVDGKTIHFWGHEVESTRIAARTLRTLSIDTNTINRVVGIISTHMLDIKSNIGRRAIERFIITVGCDNMDNWFAVRQADALCYGGPNLGSRDYLSKILGPFEKKVRQEMTDKQDKFVDPIIGSSSQIILTGEEDAEN